MGYNSFVRKVKIEYIKIEAAKNPIFDGLKKTMIKIIREKKFAVLINMAIKILWLMEKSYDVTNKKTLLI